MSKFLRHEKWIGTRYSESATVTDLEDGSSIDATMTDSTGCPVCNTECPKSLAVWNRGRWTCPRCNDSIGYKENLSSSPPPPDISDFIDARTPLEF